VAIAAFDAPVGKVIGPIDTAFGATFLRTTKEVPASNKTFEQVKPELAAKVSLEKATDILYEVVRKIEDRRSGGESISVIAKDLNLKLSTTELLDAQGNDRNSKPVANLPQDPKFLTDGFALEADRETDLVELATGRFMLVRVEEIVPQALKPLAQVKPEVIAAWSADERAAKLKALATSLVDKAKQGDFARVAAEVKAVAKMSNPLQRNRPDPEMGSEVPNALFAAQPGGIVSGLAPAGAGYVVARLERVVPVDLVREAAGLKSARNDLANSISGDLLEQYQAMLRVKYDVTINEQSLARAVGVANPSGGN
jgi:peptidyl-prolyl cis-trans isomerase D